MESCKFNDFISVLNPWLNDEYVSKAGLDDNGHFRLQLTDGGIKSYKIDDCSRDQIKEVVEMLKKRGILVEKLT